MTEGPFFAETAYTWEIVVYFFLGGLSAGCFLLSVVANYWKEDLKPLAKIGAVLAPIALAVGRLFLMVDLGKPFRFWRLLLSFNPTSALSWGVWFLNIFFGLSVVYAFLVVKGKDDKAKAVGYLGIPFALLVGGYTGVLLAQAPGRALWHSALLPVIFLVGGIVSGIALVMLVAAAKGQGETSAKLGKVLASLLIFELGMLFAEVIVLLNGGADAALAVEGLLSGQFSFLFWVVAVIMGGVLPILSLFRSKIPPALQIIASILILVGIFTVRYIVVLGGQVEVPLL